MTKKRLALFYSIVCILGVLTHYAFDFFNISFLRAFFPSNESVFEHLKLFIFPTFLFMIVDMLSTKEKNGIFPAYVSGTIVASIFMICSYYTYFGIIGEDISWVNFIIFLISVGIIFFYRYKKITLFDGSNSVIAFIVFILIIEIFTFFPTNINLFHDPSREDPCILFLNLLKDIF